MMNKKLLFTLTMAAMLASCSSEDLTGQSATQSQTDIENAVNFEAYSQRGLTRSGDAGVLDNTTLSTSGFGVFGYKTEENYSDGLEPKFMYNEHVMKAGGSWTYEPVKYWSNANGSNAQSEEVKKISFFAYAPYVAANAPETGKVADETVGITGFTRNTAQGDPYVKYIGLLDPTKCVDLCWGVCADADKTWNIIQGGSQTLTAGLPWLNVQRPQKSLGQKVKFTFKHALAQLNVQIDADIDAATHGEGIEVDANTKVFVRKVTFNGFAMRGALNLNNIVADQPLWLDYYRDGKPVQDEALTIYDGMRDGLEGTGKITAVESVTGLNPSIIQTKKWSEQAATDGVQKAAKNLFNAASADASVYVIPTGDEMKVTIEYDIETADPKLLAYTVSDDETHGTSIPYKETRTVTLSGDATQKLILEAGKKHTVKLHLGVNTVMFDAEVSDWDMTNVTDWMPDIVVATGITLNKTATEFFVAEQEQLIATVMPVDVTDDRVLWTTSDATIATVDGNGNVRGVAPGPVRITATNSAGQTATCTVTVKAIPATGISLNKTVLDMNIDDADETLVATVTPADATYKDVTWTSNNPAVATVDANGKVHPVGEGPATITATNSAGQTATCTVTVNASPTTLSALKTWVNDGHASDNTYLGYFVKADGSISTDNTDAIGVVAYYDDAAVDASAADSRILVLATANASSSAQWKTSHSGGESAYSDPDALNGIAFTNAYGDYAAYRAAQAAKGYSAGKPTGASIWFLPSKGQWTKMIDAGHTGITSGDYWSSTEVAGSDERAWDYLFDGSYWRTPRKDGGSRVRAAFAY